MTRYCLFSAGGGSFRASKIDQATYPSEAVRLVFTDTLYEDADAYRFLVEGAANIAGVSLSWSVKADDFPDYRVPEDTPICDYRGNPEWRAFLSDLRYRALADLPNLVWLVEGRDPWEVFRDGKYLGNTRVDSCSKTLKRRMLDRWRRQTCNPATDVFSVGIGEHERHRFEGGRGKAGLQAIMAEQGWNYHAPLLGNPYLFPSYRYAPLSDIGPPEPRLYARGYVHNNCGGFCIKAGLAHWQNRLRVDPQRYAYDAMMERKSREFIGTESATILRDRRGGRTVPMSLDVFRARLEREGAENYEYEPGTSGCGCMLDEG
jgi:hypothetical protein